MGFLAKGRDESGTSGGELGVQKGNVGCGMGGFAKG